MASAPLPRTKTSLVESQRSVNRCVSIGRCVSTCETRENRHNNPGRLRDLCAPASVSSVLSFSWLQFEGLEGLVLSGNQQFAGERAVGRAPAQRFLSRDFRREGVVVFLREMGENEVSGASIKAIRIGQIFAHGVIGEMARPAEDALFDD